MFSNHVLLLLAAAIISYCSSVNNRAALLKLESESQSQEHSLRESLCRAHETIRAYELMLHTTAEPADTTAALSMSMRMHTTADNGSISNTGLSGGVPLAVSVLASDPRRLRLLLETSERNTLKLTTQDRLIAELRAKTTELESAVGAKHDQICVLESVIDAARHPAAYVLSRLQEREEQIVQQKREISRLTSQGTQLEEAVAACRREGEGLRERLKTLLEQRAEIEGLKELLQTVCMEGESDEDGSDDEASAYSTATGDATGRGVWGQSRHLQDGGGGYEEDGMWHENESTQQHQNQHPHHPQQHPHHSQHQQQSVGSGSGGRGQGQGRAVLKVSQQQLIDSAAPADVYSSPSRQHQQQTTIPSPHALAITTPVSKPPAAAGTAAAARGGGTISSGSSSSNSSPKGGAGDSVGGGMGVGIMGALSPAAVRAMTERSKGPGPTRTRVVQQEEEEEDYYSNDDE